MKDLEIQFILNGKITKLKCKHRKNGTNEGEIETFHCKGIKDIAVLVVNEGKQGGKHWKPVVLVNPNYENNNGTLEVEKKYIYFILCEYFKDYLVVDLCMSNYFGYMNTIDFIKETCKDSEAVKRRVEALENVIKTNGNVQVITKDALLGLFRTERGF